MQPRSKLETSIALQAAIEPLEIRLFLSAAKAKTTVIDLIDLALLPKKTASTLSAATATAYHDATSTAARNGATTNLSAIKFTAFTLDLPTIKRALAKAPLEFTRAARTPLAFALPLPDGTFSRFNVVEAPIIEAGLARKFPDIKTYRGQGIDDPTATIRFDYTSLGFHAQVLSARTGAFYVDPYHLNDASGPYASYFKRDVPRPSGVYNLDDARAIATAGKTVGATPRGATTKSLPLDAAPFGSQLRTFRTAVAANGEYTQAVGGGTVAGGQAAVVTAMNRVNGVYETELAIRLTLIANNNTIIYTDPITDPYSNSSNAMNENTPNLNDVIGIGGYDIGHVFTTGSGGQAILGCVGNAGFKGAGTSGTGNPVGDPFVIDYVAHEMGHQFNANHTFNTSSDPNRSASHAYEPGSGSTIMAYAGITSDDFQGNSDPYFHSDSIDSIRAFVTSSIPNIGTTTSTGNAAPTVSAGISYTIPTGTPFILTASGSDPNGDPITYDWQERDLGPANLLSSPDNGSSPIVRARVPSTSASRMVPQLSNLLNNNFAPGEKLPAVARANFNWRVIACDNRSGGGGVSSDDVTLHVVNTGAAFLITSSNSGANLQGNSTLNVAWNVAGTTGNGIDVANVKISMSINNGATFAIVLAASTANDGSEDITVPNINASNGRIKVEAIGNIFFDINNAGLTITQQAVANGTWTGSGDGVSWNQNTNWSNNVVPGSGDSVTINVPGDPTINVAGAQSVLSVNSSEALNITGSLSVAQSSTFNAAVTLSGGTFDGAGNATFSGGLTWNGGSMTGAGNTTIPIGASLNITGAGVSTTSRALVINGSGSLASGGNKVLVVGALTIGGQLDLNDNDMVIDYTGASPLAAIQMQINAARNGGNWLGTSGITSSSARNINPKITTLGVIESASYISIYGPVPFSGASIEPTAVLVKYTYYGDNDFNGIVNFDDYARIDNGFSSNLTGWLNGDLDGNGIVNFDDYSLIDLAFNSQGATL
ncbi:hypothetical protein BH09PLA1_BH09PLA1_09920 [soil metagenome]